MHVMSDIAHNSISDVKVLMCYACTEHLQTTLLEGQQGFPAHMCPDDAR